jgi:hypothetical protein
LATRVVISCSSFVLGFTFTGFLAGAPVAEVLIEAQWLGGCHRYDATVVLGTAGLDSDELEDEAALLTGFEYDTGVDLEVEAEAKTFDIQRSWSKTTRDRFSQAREQSSDFLPIFKDFQEAQALEYV